MKKVMQAELSDKSGKLFTKIELPATFEEMEDCLEKIHGTSENSKVISAECLMEYDLIGEKELEPCSLYEFNHFATVVENLDEVDQQRFEALTVLACKNDAITVNELINIAMNLNEIDMHYIPVLNDKELGDFYIDNGFLPQLDNFPTDKADWMISHINCKKVGKEMREQENGIYCGRGYVVLNEKLEQLYNGNFSVPKPKGYVFCLEIAKAPIGDIPNDEYTVTLTLPASNRDIITAVKKIGASAPQECVFYEYESTIPQLEEKFEDMSDLYTLNELARKIETMKACGGIPKYKALLSTLDKFNLQTALEVTEYQSEFILESECDTPSEYGMKMLKDIELPFKEELLFYIFDYGYGTALMQKNGVEKTPYGMLVPLSGVALSMQMEENKPTMTMEMK
ncbi:antirestriction protein ArdA [Anaerotignum sp. MB30-C6]|uniref:antirestriction protein ArdA n=1 Tax=Anaerotignum sp. MB30-C6 TaxID=3070814 RepID=UPI0027DB0A1F|nr:antirestriction protein ArdA [Anaerotignum sp. MB30-C6]WMI82402.1 hypothetical protein RBQ60_06595 [Anaerotignum sp. MB30-C6]